MLFAIACAIYIYLPSDFGDTRLYDVRLHPVYSTFQHHNYLLLIVDKQITVHIHYSKFIIM